MLSGLHTIAQDVLCGKGYVLRTYYYYVKRVTFMENHPLFFLLFCFWTSVACSSSSVPHLFFSLFVVVGKSSWYDLRGWLGVKQQGPYAWTETSTVVSDYWRSSRLSRVNRHFWGTKQRWIYTRDNAIVSLTEIDPSSDGKHTFSVSMGICVV